MESLEAEAIRLLRASLAPNTQVTYDRCIESFSRFLRCQNFSNSWPVSSRTVMAYIAYMSLQNSAPATISIHISAIAYAHKVNGWPDPTDCFVVKKMKEGYKRQNPRVDSRNPITYRLLCRLVDVLPSICSSDFEASLFKAAFYCHFLGS